MKYNKLLYRLTLAGLLLVAGMAGPALADPTAGATFAVG